MTLTRWLWQVSYLNSRLQTLSFPLKDWWHTAKEISTWLCQLSIVCNYGAAINSNSMNRLKHTPCITWHQKLDKPMSTRKVGSIEISTGSLDILVWRRWLNIKEQLSTASIFLRLIERHLLILEIRISSLLSRHGKFSALLERLSTLYHQKVRYLSATIQ